MLHLVSVAIMTTVIQMVVRKVTDRSRVYIASAARLSPRHHWQSCSVLPESRDLMSAVQPAASAETADRHCMLHALLSAHELGSASL